MPLMPCNRFYLNGPIEKGEVFLEGDELHHLAHVMRMREGEELELVNGKGVLAEAKLIKLDKKKARLDIQGIKKRASHPPQILLGLPLLRPSKLEWILEKGTELGVDAFLLYPSDLGEKKGFSSHQLERMGALLIAAMKQSGRLFLPSLEALPHLDNLLKKEAFIMYGDTRDSSSALQEIVFPALFITGPESGFSEKEYALLEEKGKGIRLAEHILRAETAPLAAASLLSWKKLLSR